MKILSILIIIAIIIIIYYFIFCRKLYHSKAILSGNNHIDTNKLMIVAHPDDELIFGGKELLAEPGWLVVCVTNGSNRSGNLYSLHRAEKRIKEFITVMNSLNCKYEMWDYEDNGFNAHWNEKSLIEQLKQLLEKNKFVKIITHNLQGEYGHVQHKKISELVHGLKPDNLYVFGYSDNIKNIIDKPIVEINPYLTQLEQALSYYSSQENIIAKYYTNILYQSIHKVNFLS